MDAKRARMLFGYSSCCSTKYVRAGLHSLVSEQLNTPQNIELLSSSIGKTCILLQMFVGQHVRYILLAI